MQEEKHNEEQLKNLSAEGVAFGKSSTEELVRLFNLQTDRALQQVGFTDENTLTDVRMVGRANIPSTVIGLLVHAAEHTMRHVGQLHVTVKVIKDGLRTGL